MSLFYHKILGSANNRCVLEVSLHIPSAALQIGRPSINHYRATGTGCGVVSVLGYDLSAALKAQYRVSNDDPPVVAEGVVIRIDDPSSGFILPVEVPLESVEKRKIPIGVRGWLVYRADSTVALVTLVKGVNGLASGEGSGT